MNGVRARPRSGIRPGAASSCHRGAEPGLSEVYHQGPPGRAAPGPPEIPAVVLSGITVRFRGRTEPSVDGLSLTIPKGQIFGLLGLNGSGKTTTINVIVGLLTPGAGDVVVVGGDPRSLATHRGIGVLIQETALYPKLSGRGNLDFYASLYGYTRRQRRARVDAALKLANLEQFARQPVGSYSGGMARRLAIARAMLHSPRLLILDEPTLGVDPYERSVLWEHIRQLRDTGITVVVTTNVLEEAEALCDAVAILQGGRLVTREPASPERLRRQYGAMVITIRARASQEVRQQGMAALRAVREITYLQDTTIDEQGEFVIQATSVQRGITGQLIMLLREHGVVILDLDKREPALEDVFRELTTGPMEAAR